jgi:hypothetical protein
MIKHLKSFLFLPFISLVMTFLLGASTASGESYIPPVPDKSKTLPANDGGQDGCDSSRFKSVIGDDKDNICNLPTT